MTNKPKGTLSEYRCDDESKLSSDKRFFSARSVEDPFYKAKRSPYLRDKQRILSSRGFNRLTHKTQLFVIYEGDYRNRLTHTLLTASLASYLSESYELNTPLTESISLGHDIGHTPFGHAGERALNELLYKKIESKKNAPDYLGLDYFKHNIHSLKIAEYLAKQFLCVNEDESTEDNLFKGLNLTLAVREGILLHTSVSDACYNFYDACMLKLQPKFRRDNIILSKEFFSGRKVHKDYLSSKGQQCSYTLEGQIVSISDEIAQISHDIEDGCRNNLISFEQLKETEVYKSMKKYYTTKAKNPDQDVLKKVLDKIETSRDDLFKKQSPSNIVVSFENTRNFYVSTLIKNYLLDKVKQKVDKEINLIEEFYDTIEFGGSKRRCFIRPLFDFPKEVYPQIRGIKNLIKNTIHGNSHVCQSDFRGAKIIEKLFDAFVSDPKLLPYARRQEFEKLSGDTLIPGLKFWAIADHLQGMTDFYANQVYSKIYGALNI